MKQVASFELSKELWELSNWDPEEFGAYYMGYPLVWATDIYSDGQAHHQLIWDGTFNNDEKYVFIAPCYEVGYLLRKLPYRIRRNGVDGVLYMQKRDSGYYYGYLTPTGQDFPFDQRAIIHQWSEEPEDALATLAIELFKKEILTPQKEGN